MEHPPRKAARIICTLACALLLAGDILRVYALSAPLALPSEPHSADCAQAPDDSPQITQSPYEQDDNHSDGQDDDNSYGQDSTPYPGGDAAASTPSPAEPGTRDITADPGTLPPCETPAQLQALLQNNDGGTVTLTGNIEWREYGGLYTDMPTKIEMGDYRVVAYDYLILGNGLSFVGSGNAGPLFQVESGGYLNMGEASVTSTGDGAVTLRLESGAGLYMEQNSRVCALGNGAVAIDCAGSLTLSGGRVEAPGRDGTGIRTAGEADIQSAVIYAGDTGIRASGNIKAFYSLVDAGNIAVLSDSGTVSLDCAKVSPEPENAAVTTRLAIPFGWYHLARYGFCVEPGQEPGLISVIEYYLINKNDPEDIERMSLHASWETGDFNPNIPGKYSLYVTAPDTLVDVEGFVRTQVPVYVVNPSAPWLTYPEWRGDSCEIFFFRPIEDARDVRLLYSADEGDTWFDAGDDFDGSMTGSSFVLNGLDEKKTYLLRLEVTGGSMAGESNILMVCGDPSASAGDNRDGGDREGTGPLPPVTTPGGSDSGQSGGAPSSPPGQNEGYGYHDDTGMWPYDNPGVQSDAHGYTPPQEAPQFAPAPIIEDVPATIPALASAYPDGSLRYSVGELADMAAANSRRLVFISGGVRASVPMEALAKALAGKPDFAIWMDQPEDTRFAVRMFAGGGELYDLGGEQFQIYISYNAEGDVVCTDDSGVGVPVGVEENTVVCSLTRTGSYTISNASTATVHTPARDGDSYRIPDGAHPGRDSPPPAPDNDDAPPTTQQPAQSHGVPAWIRMLWLPVAAAIGLLPVTRRFRRWRSGG